MRLSNNFIWGKLYFKKLVVVQRVNKEGIMIGTLAFSNDSQSIVTQWIKPNFCHCCTFQQLLLKLVS